MAPRDMYSIIIEVMFGNKSLIYVIFNNFLDRKYSGPKLSDMLESQGVKIVYKNASEWRLELEDDIKYINLSNSISALDYNMESVAVIIV